MCHVTITVNVDVYVLGQLDDWAVELKVWYFSFSGSH